MFKQIREDVRAIMERDPAARSFWEVYFLYPGFKAVRAYRRARWFYDRNRFFIARLISERSRKKTGIEIHPGAKIGKGLMIDHGSGVVIGETAVIGDHCTIYQGVTLGGTGKDTGKRHPTLGNHVMVGSGARVLGPFKVGDHAKIAAGAVVLEEVPPYATAVGVPARIAGSSTQRPMPELDQVHIPDPIAQELCRMQLRLDQMGERIKALEDGE